MTFEVGIRNAGLGLGLVFTFFGGLGGMAIVAGWWGIWDIIAGLAVATLWARHTRRQDRLRQGRRLTPGAPGNGCRGPDPTRAPRAGSGSGAGSRVGCGASARRARASSPVGSGSGKGSGSGADAPTGGAE